jgi:hypothetical protein
MDFDRFAEAYEHEVEAVPAERPLVVLSEVWNPQMTQIDADETTKVTYLDARPNSCYIAKDYEGY